jgi:hypothetical protein
MNEKTKTKKDKDKEEPVYIYHLFDGRGNHGARARLTGWHGARAAGRLGARILLRGIGTPPYAGRLPFGAPLVALAFLDASTDKKQYDVHQHPKLTREQAADHVLWPLRIGIGT